MTINLKIIAACELIERMDGGTSVDVRGVLGVSPATASNILMAAFCKGLLTADKRHFPRRYQVTADWHVLSSAAEKHAPVEPEQSRVLASLVEPATLAQIAARLKMHQGCVSRALKMLSMRGLAHISGWAATTKKGGRPSAVYSQGKGSSKKPERPLTATAIAILELLPAASCQLQEKLGVSRSRVNEVLHSLAGQIHISGWLERDGIKPAAIYGRGCGPTAARIPATRKSRAFDGCEDWGVVQLPTPDSPLYCTPWAGLELCRMGVRV